MNTTDQLSVRFSPTYFKYYSSGKVVTLGYLENFVLDNFSEVLKNYQNSVDSRPAL